MKKEILVAMLLGLPLFAGQANASQCLDCGDPGGVGNVDDNDDDDTTCVDPDTLVTLESGKQVAIKEVSVGDKVMTADMVATVMEVTNKKLDKKMYELVDSNNNKLLATEHHPIFTKEKGYIKMSEVKEGYTLKTVKGESKVVSNKMVDYKGDTVFNLKINKDIAKDNFYAGGILIGGLYQQRAINK